LELRPRRLREAAAIWRGLTDARGIEGRDAVWAHPDLLPTAEDFDDPDGFVRGRPDFDISDLESEGAKDEAAKDEAAKDEAGQDEGDEKPGSEGDTPGHGGPQPDGDPPGGS
ncbi:MAG: zinc-dependent metalloprotease, partial [Streptosporangiaceae bacterium]